jgi:hypothetical protein
MLKQDNEPQLADTAHLTDADWTEINKINQAYTKRGQRGFEKALDALYKRDQLRWLKVVWAYYPRAVRDAMSDTMAGWGLTAGGFAK